MIQFPEDVVAAADRLNGIVLETETVLSPWLSSQTGGRVHLKLENLQQTGSFKVRGALNRMLVLGEQGRSRGVVAASSGNHGMAVAHGSRVLGCRARVFVPETTPDHKVAAIELLGAEVERTGRDCLITEQTARTFAANSGAAYVAPYNDPVVVAGQGTVGLELHRQLERIDAVLVSLGGGGLIAGIGGTLHAMRSDVEIVACSPEHSPVMHRSLEAGRILEMDCLETLSDATAGGVEADSITFELCRSHVDRSVLVSEPAIAEGIRELLDHHGWLVEGSAGVAVAALLAEAERYRDREVAVVLCGANIDRQTLQSIL